MIFKIGAGLLLVASITAFGVWNHFQQARDLPGGSKEGLQLTEVANDFITMGADATPFQEMTIPFLRQRTYESSLADLQPLDEKSTYRSYLTSYQSDGLRINGLLTQPTGEQPAGGWPAIVFVHGYIAPSVYRTQERYVDHVDYLARNGFVVFKIDLRGHDQSEGEASGAYYSADYVIDTLHAYAALADSDFVNPEKIGLWGHSMAGNIVLRSLAAQPEIPAVVIWGGAGFSYEDLRTYQISDSSYRPPTSPARQRRRDELFNTHGQFQTESQFWKDVAPTNFLSDVQGSIALHHATNDDVVDVRYSRDLNQLLDQTAIDHEFYEYAQGGHNISGASFTEAMQRTVDFFRRTL